MQLLLVALANGMQVGIRMVLVNGDELGAKPQSHDGNVDFSRHGENDDLSRQETELDRRGTKGERLAGKPCSLCGTDLLFRRIDSLRCKWASSRVNVFLRTSVVFFHQFGTCGRQ
jgi:hypothetical protein